MWCQRTAVPATMRLQKRAFLQLAIAGSRYVLEWRVLPGVGGEPSTIQ